MCYCTIIYNCDHFEANTKPYHCKCGTFALGDKKYTRKCDDCVIEIPYTASSRDEGRRFENESIPEMRVRVAQDANRAGEEEYEGKSTVVNRAGGEAYEDNRTVANRARAEAHEEKSTFASKEMVSESLSLRARSMKKSRKRMSWFGSGETDKKARNSKEN